MSLPGLVLFDLDHTLLSGDSDVLWCDFLMARGILDRATFAPRNADMEAQYKAGTVSAEAFAGFYVSTLEGRTREQWEPLRREFLTQEIIPRIPVAAMQLVQRHRREGDLVVMTTATNRFITELTAQHFGIEHLIATEAQVDAEVFTGRTEGTLNMREGKVWRLEHWLAARGHTLDNFRSAAYSDSMNDLALLEAVDEPVAVDPDPRLAALALARGWPVLRLHPVAR
ncbi:HAD family hydrolase [Caenimonas koreensis]|uniref:HAD family hydrolase n=1 Tax=Caenimonas koreensis TaxID=367474 RepID=UPI0037848A05